MPRKKLKRVLLTHRTPQVREAEKKLTAALKRSLKALGKNIALEVIASLGLGKAEGGDDKKADKAADEAVSGADVAAIADAAKEQLTDVAKDGARRTLAVLGVSDDEAITEQTFDDAVDWAEARAAELVGKSWDEDGNLVDNEDADMAITDSLREEIRQAVADALERGDSAQDLASSIEGLAGFSAERAELISRTEIIRAHGQGQLQAMRESGVVERKGWSTSEDGDVCDDCAANEDQGDIALEDDFQSDDDAPPAHPNCRCALVAAFPEEAEEETADEDEEAAE